ncbi:EmrB/QacA family drug resistance transporter [Paractinoplanes abujensis]|uniref:EmrB/QacA subfamily drug resistance transporter n=1 Tax=Paractinoplanes abujensis TaxID=882441 RepID=A0A7W7G572_9ACTN|nr:MDR family MFS transporter [Actinoplanes abujensis]MBB4696309.1 EmrB/QacA subfamily drug resistance transporter [Actinoplanes abujensis]GID22300.1 EmrB/QacA family drug resistance transporter [Actinoplanes abujensis]
MSATTVGTRPGAMSHRQIMEALSGLLLVLFVAMASSTIVSTALPKIIGALEGSQTQYTWVVTATLLTATASTPIWGKLADLYSKKLLVQIAIVVFVLGSIIAGFSQTAGQLIAARAFQGLGMGGVQALVQVAIAAMIPPRERGRYNGYLGGVMALATVGGPLLGGLIVDTDWLGWRWCFFIGAPIAVVALVVLQKTLNLEVIRRADVKIDYLGATLIAAGVSVLLVWVSFVDSNFAWISWPTLAMVGPGLLLLAAAVWVESRVAEPVVPLDIVKQRGTALSIIASLAVGMAMFGGAVFLGQYFQIGRGYSPTEAGLLTIPMMAGILVSSTVSGRMITKSGRIKPYIVTGTIVLVGGFALLSFLDHQTPLWFVGVAMALVGAGVGMSMQNLVLSVQNTVSLKDIGAASSTIAFFRSLGGTIGVSVLGAVLAHRVSDQITRDLASAGVPAGSTSGGSTLNLAALPDSIQHIVRAAYGDATGHIFLISAAIAVVGVVAAVLMRPTSLRSTVDVTPSPAQDQEPVPALSR